MLEFESFRCMYAKYMIGVSYVFDQASRMPANFLPRGQVYQVFEVRFR